MEDFRIRAYRVINGTFGGESHVWCLKWESQGDCPWCSFNVPDRLSTWDYDSLTRFVVLCHDNCVRGEVMRGSKRYELHIRIFSRSPMHATTNAMVFGHPSLDENILRIRESLKPKTLCPECGNSVRNELETDVQWGCGCVKIL